MSETIDFTGFLRFLCFGFLWSALDFCGFYSIFVLKVDVIEYMTD